MTYKKRTVPDEKRQRKHGGGRKTILSEPLIVAICKLISEGNYIKTACQACGISETTYNEWNNRGMEDVNNNRGDTLYAKFHVQTKIARAKVQTEILSVIMTNARSNKPSNWLSAAWMAERMWPDLFARRLEVPQIDNRTIVVLREIGQGLIKELPIVSHETQLLGMPSRETVTSTEHVVTDRDIP